MNKQKLNITVCNKVCSTCGFTKDGTSNTLYADFYDIVKEGKIFPCHMYLKSKTGFENLGTETLDEIKVCRGYVAFIKKYPEFMNDWSPQIRFVWESSLLSKIEPNELDNIQSLAELVKTHKGLRLGLRLDNF